jgi:hypothetical protein
LFSFVVKVAIPSSHARQSGRSDRPMLYRFVIKRF